MTSTATRGTPGAGLFGATLGFFVGFAAVALFGPTATRFRELMDLSPVMVGLLVAMPSLTGSLLRIPFSAWVDTTGGRKPFLVLLTLSVAGMLGLALVVNTLYPERLDASIYPLLLVLGALCGCGIATFSVGISQVSYWYPQKRQGRALGTYAGIGNLAPGMFSMLLPFALAGWGLGPSYVAWFVFLALGTLLYGIYGRNAWFFQLASRGMKAEEARAAAREAGQEIFPSGTLLGSLRVSAGIWKTWALVGIYFTTFGGFIALTAWFPTYWKSLFGVSAVAAGFLTAAYSLTTSILRVVGGGVSDRLGGERTALMSLSVMLAGALLLVTSSSVVVGLVGELILACGMGVANAAVFKLVPQEVPKAVGGAAGWVGGLGAFGGFAIPPVMGLFVRGFDERGYALGFLVYVGLAVVSLLLALRLRGSHAALPAPAAAVNSAP